MTKPALQALYEALYGRLTATTELWGPRAYPDFVPATIQRPYVVFFWSGGGEANTILRPDAEYLISIKCVADTLAQAMTGAGRIGTLFNDADLSSATALNGGAEWEIVNATQERAVHLLETIDGRQIYHDGHQFRFYMNAKR